MIRENTAKILQNIDGERAFSTVAEVSVFHRIQASTGYRAAANFMKDKLDRMGIPGAEILHYPAKEDVIFGTYPSFKEWNIRGAWCDLVWPEERRLADYDRCAMSVIQRSIGCDYTGQPIDIVMLDKGPEEKNYRNVDLAGKIVFVRQNINDVYDWAVEKRGAIGLITDMVLEAPHVRERHDQSDTLRYTSFWWEPGQKKAFGFLLSPREGDKLAELCAQLAKKGKYPQVKCRVDAELYDGEIENVTACLPGETDEEILMVGHLCHPRQSANDNASGTASVVEAIKTISDMIASGKLAPLNRSLRILLLPEFTGSFAYLESLSPERRAKIKAAINLDMVGGRQLAGYGPMTITELPMAEPSFVSDVAAAVLDEVKHEVEGMSKGSYCPMFNSHILPYTGGSDHVVLSDPKTDIPCVMLGQWPDRFYHTSSDTLDKVDPFMLSRAAAITASYAYSLANLEEGDAADILNTGLGRAGMYITDQKTEVGRGALDEKYLAGRIHRYIGWRLASMDRLTEWLGDGVLEQTEDAKKRLKAMAKAILGYDPTKAPKSVVTKAKAQKYGLVVRRSKSVPTMMEKLPRMFSGEKREAVEAYLSKYGRNVDHTVSGAMDYFIDGKSTAAEIAAQISCEFGQSVSPEAVDAYERALIAIGFAEEV